MPGLAGAHRAAAARSRARRRRRHPSRGRYGGRRGRAKCLEAAVDRDQPLLGEPLLRAEGLGGAEQPGQRVVDVAGRDQLHAGQARPARVRGRGRSAGPAAATRRPAGRSAVAPSAASSPAPPSLVPLPPRPTTTRRAPAPACREQQLSDAEAWTRPRRRRRRQVQAAGLGASRRTPSSPTRSTVGRHRLAERAADRHRQQLAAERGVQHVDEAGAAVGHRAQVELVAGALPPPARPRSPRRPRRR